VVGDPYAGVMPKRSSKPRDTNALAAAIVAQATNTDSSEAIVTVPAERKNPAAVELGRLGGQKGGPARARSLTREQRSEIARKAARARWRTTDRP
jgi:hypothetical protein